MLIEALKRVQDRHGYLPRTELASIARELGIPLYQVHGVASFYPHFRLDPRAQFEIGVCTDLSCHMHNAESIFLDLSSLATRHSPLSVKRCPCLGLCDRGPALTINGVNYSDVDSARLEAILTSLREGRVPSPAKWRKSRLPTLSEAAPYAVLPRVESGELGAAQIIETLKQSGLRGMGGAGFPAGAKWEIVRNALPGPAVISWYDARRGVSAAEKYVVCNADESEPGTFKDRDILRTAPHLVLEGMMIAAQVVGASEAIVYIRHEYHRECEVLERVLRKVRRRFRPPLHPSIRVFVSPGGYICGEESALLEALEGKRAEPRNKPPFPGTHGLFGRPTLINNVETFAWVPLILAGGAEWFAGQGRNDAKGLKMFALSGDVRLPGVYEVPLGTTARELIEQHGGGVRLPRSISPRPRFPSLKAFMPGGASSGFLPGSMLDTPLEFQALARAGSMLGSGAVIVIGPGRCMLDLALNVTRFFRDESCGKCVPCREGSKHLVELLDRARRGEGSDQDLETIGGLAEAMQLTSICGLGQAAPLPITSVFTHFPEEVEAHIRDRRCPEGVCFT